MNMKISYWCAFSPKLVRPFPKAGPTKAIGERETQRSSPISRWKRSWMREERSSSSLKVNRNTLAEKNERGKRKAKKSTADTQWLTKAWRAIGVVFRLWNVVSRRVYRWWPQLHMPPLWVNKRFPCYGCFLLLFVLLFTPLLLHSCYCYIYFCTVCKISFILDVFLYFLTYYSMEEMKCVTCGLFVIVYYMDSDWLSSILKVSLLTFFFFSFALTMIDLSACQYF